MYFLICLITCDAFFVGESEQKKKSKQKKKNKIFGSKKVSCKWCAGGGGGHLG